MIFGILSYLKTSYRIDLKKNFVYPANFWLVAFLIPIMSIIQIIFIDAIFKNTNNFLGYTRYETFVLFGTYRIVQSIGYLFFSTKLEELKELIVGGGLDSFDNILLKPIDSQLYATIGKLNLGNISPIIVGISIVWYGLVKQPHEIGFMNVISYLFIMVMGTLVMYFSFLFLRSLLFWFDNIQVTANLWIELQNFGQYPMELYKGGLGIFLNFVIPITLMAAVPSNFLFGRMSWYMFFVYLFIIGVLFVVTRWFWKFSIKRYSGFSS